MKNCPGEEPEPRVFNAFFGFGQIPYSGENAGAFVDKGAALVLCYYYRIIAQ